MFNVVLIAPEIPPNTGNVIRLCANTGTRLHLVKPLGFDLTDKQLQRAGLDYHEYASVLVHDSFDALLASEMPDWSRVIALSTRATRFLSQQTLKAGDWFVFGSETSGLDPSMRARFAPSQFARLPLRPGSRSLNLSNAVAVVVFEAWRQNDFSGSV